MPKKAAELGALQVSRLVKPGTHAVGGVAGLKLKINDAGARSWVLRATVGGKIRDMGLGGFPDVTLAQARERARAARDKIHAGKDPIQGRQAARSATAAARRNEQYERSLDAFGRGGRAREEVEAQKSIRKEFDRYMLSANEKASAVDPKTGRNALDSQSYKAEVEKIKASLADALGRQQKYFDDLKAKQADWKNGATEALANYADAVNNVSASTDRAITNAFKGGEDELTKFVTTGKGSFKSLADSIIADLARIGVQKRITGPLAKGLEGILQGDEMKDFLKEKGIIGSSSGGIDWGKAFSTVGDWFSGKFFADGGAPPVGMASVVGERGPELFVPSVPGTIIPNNQLGGGGGSPVTVIQNFTVGDVASISMVRQAVAGSEARIAGGVRRSRSYAGEAAQ